MFDFNINNPNEFVPEGTVPNSTIGKGGLSAMNDAARGSPQQPKLLGGLQGEKGQAELENMLFPRIRSMDQINQARTDRRSKLAQAQAALQMDDDDLDPFDHILQGMMANPDPSQVGTGFRLGVGNALSARQKKGLSKKKGAIEAANLGLDFEMKEGNNDEQLENTAISNLRSLARPFLSNGAKGLGTGGAGGRGGNPYRWVPGTGLVNLADLDESGTPKIVFNDTKTGQGIRSQALRLATQEVESDLHKMTFKSSAERAEYIEQRANEIAAEIAGGATLPGPAVAPGLRPSTSSGGAAAPAAKAAPAGAGKPGMSTSRSAAEAAFKAQQPALKVDPEGRFATLQFELEEAQKAGRTADVQALQREISRLPANERPRNYSLETPEERAGKSAFNQAMSKSDVDSYDAVRKGQQQALITKSTVNELRQLKFTPGYFEKWKQRGGNILEAFGSNGPLAQAARQSGNAQKLLQGLTNARVALEKGVQTDGDVERFKNEIASITDPKEGYKYMLAYMEELSNKQIEQFNTIDRFQKQNGSLKGAEQAWQQRHQAYGGLVRRINNTTVRRSEFIEKFVSHPANKKAYAGREAELLARAEREWAKIGEK